MEEDRSASPLPIDSFHDSRGSLFVLENGGLPFRIERVFAITDVPADKSRGDHAHYRCHYVMSCIQGAADVALDNGVEKSRVRLGRPGMALHVPPLNWIRVENFAPGTVLLVMASHPYDPSDNLDDYNQFIRLARLRARPEQSAFN